MKALLKRITVDPAVMTGLPCIRGLRIPVTTILGLLAAGATREEVLKEYPDLEAEDLRACMAYAAWRTREREIELEPA
jgi:uncharacterized protein (DUF433 family)